MVAQIDSLYAKTRPLKVLPRLTSYALFEGRPLTTKGRWINPLVFTHFAIEKHLPLLQEIRKPIFIVGTGRSGSTVLGVLMSMHREVGFLNEPKALWNAIYPGEDVVGNYTRYPARYRLDHKDATDEVRRRAHRLFGAYLRAVGSSRVVDKYPELIFRIPFVRAIFPDAKFVFLVRDGRETCRSIDRWSDRLGAWASGEVHDWWGADKRKWNLILEELVSAEGDLAPHAGTIAGFTCHTDMAAVEWIVTMREGMRRLKQNPDRVHLLYYESLLESPKRELSKLLEFCELPRDEVFYSFAERKLTTPEAVEGGLELHPVVARPFEKTLLELGYG